MRSLLNQIKERRTELGLRQHDMMPRAGISRQQYHRLESRGNPRLDTLERVAVGLRSELLLVPREKLNAVLPLLSGDFSVLDEGQDAESIADDPWQGLLVD